MTVAGLPASSQLLLAAVAKLAGSNGPILTPLKQGFLAGNFRELQGTGRREKRGMYEAAVTAIWCHGCEKWLTAQDASNGNVERYPVMVQTAYLGLYTPVHLRCRSMLSLYVEMPPVGVTKEQLS